ncbi:hypothetical protein BC938DRAFT_474078 [Jimgerdemannia flammicorona]|uniref:Uncharacterized protein n=1 Tax=Jimgerdemannia flammicorona TaxID=994334 RepID=A0A433QST8_9FUNG|nr:hypothetical protein BC938DRAFT_474078 [Jimgerdemannia flammicorona]
MHCRGDQLVEKRSFQSDRQRRLLVRLRAPPAPVHHPQKVGLDPRHPRRREVGAPGKPLMRHRVPRDRRLVRLVDHHRGRVVVREDVSPFRRPEGNLREVGSRGEGLRRGLGGLGGLGGIHFFVCKADHPVIAKGIGKSLGSVYYERSWNKGSHASRIRIDNLSLLPSYNTHPAPIIATMSSKHIDTSILNKVPNLVSEDPSIVTPTNSRYSDPPWESLSRLADEATATTTTATVPAEQTKATTTNEAVSNPASGSG